MCWNSQVSLNTFLFSFSVLILIYINRNGKYRLENFHNKYVYLFFFSIIAIQLFEYFLWKNIDNKKMNRLLSIIGLIIILSQPFFSILTFEDKNKKNKYLLFYLFFILCIILFTLKKINFSTSVKNGHLQWNWLKLSCLGFFMYMYLLFIPLSNINRIYGLSLLFLSLYNYNNDNTWGSMWCYWSNIVFLFFLVTILIIKPLKEYNKLC